VRGRGTKRAQDLGLKSDFVEKRSLSYGKVNRKETTREKTKKQIWKGQRTALNLRSRGLTNESERKDGDPYLGREKGRRVGGEGEIETNCKGR